MASETEKDEGEAGGRRDRKDDPLEDRAVAQVVSVGTANAIVSLEGQDG